VRPTQNQITSLSGELCKTTGVDKNLEEGCKEPQASMGGGEARGGGGVGVMRGGGGVTTNKQKKKQKKKKKNILGS